MINRLAGSFVLLSVLMFATGSHAANKPVSTDRLLGAATDADNWLTHGKDYREQRFSDLDQVSTDNIDELKLDWYHDFNSTRGLEATPLVIDGYLYTTDVWNKVYAFDATNGKLVWQYDPEVNREVGVKLCCDAVNRGLAAYDGSLFTGTLDGRLIALDRQTGNEQWSVQTTPPDESYSITGAPRVVKGKIMIGNGGGEFGVRGYFSAYDPDNGELIWRFYTVPGKPGEDDSDVMEMAASTWSGDWWKLGGGGTAWDSMAYDPDLDLLYVGVGNGSPWNREIRSDGEGDNLFLSSIVAVRPDTGEYVWHYQTTPGEEWDYTATQHMILADLKIDGENREVIMQAPKNGNFYVLDRKTGEFISGENYVDVNWMSGFDEKGRPKINPDARYSKTGKPWLANPSPFGGHNWQPMSFNPDTGLVYFPTRTMAFAYIAEEGFQPSEKKLNLGADLHAASMPQDPEVKAAIKAATKGKLVAWDPVQQEEVWGIDQPVPWNGGTLSTGGNLVFQGDGKGYLKAFDATTGDEVWSWFAQTGIIAPPVSYRVNGTQYIAVMAGWGGAVPLVIGELVSESLAAQKNRLLVFSLDGDEQLPKLEQKQKELNPPARVTDSELIKHGKLKYHRHCGACHGDAVVSGGVLPDLRYMSQQSFDIFDAIVLYGLKKDQGMVGFESVLSKEDSKAIKAYVIDRAHQTLSQQKMQK